LQQIPRWKVGAKADLEARLAVVNIELTDAKQAHQRVQVALQ
jgi:hypothetical protein